jgi:hypothetical protein
MFNYMETQYVVEVQSYLNVKKVTAITKNASKCRKKERMIFDMLAP